MVTVITKSVEPNVANMIEQHAENMVEDIPKTGKIVVENKNDSLAGEYMSKPLTEKEKAAASLLQDNFTAFLSKTHDIEPEASIKSVLPTGIDLMDTILGGGFATKCNQVVGFPGAGKSALVSKVLATGQKKWPGKFLGLYVDSEQSMSTERLAQLGAGNPLIVPYSDDITVEKIFKCVEGVCTFKEEHKEYMDTPSCIIWDSVANTLTDKGMDSEEVKSVLGQKAATLSFNLPKYVSKLNKYNICLLCVNQLRDKIEMGMTHTPPTLKFLADKNIPGGNSLLYNSFQLVIVRQSATLKEYGFDGVRVLMRTIKNKLFTPNIEISMIFSFQHGFSNFWTNYELLKDNKRITASGAWMTLNNYDGKKFQQKNAIQLYQELPEFRAAWDSGVKETLQTEYRDKYKFDLTNPDIF